MTTTSEDPLNQAAESFMARVRNGETPSIAEYADRYPELADEIRDLFPTLAVVERVGNREATRPPHCQANVPEKLGDYVLLRQIARGGMGVVYEAYQTSLGRRVALKTLGHHLEHDKKALLRFRREARSAAQLHHTNIVPVHDVGEHEGVHYYSMQYIEGQSLDRVWSELQRIRTTGSAGPSDNLVHDLADSLLTQPTSGTQKLNPRSSPDEVAPRIGGAKGTAEPSGPMVLHQDSTKIRNARLLEVAPDVRESTTSTSSGVHLLLDRSTASTTPDRQYFRNIASVALQVLDAVAYAHQRGVLHRDVKPSNIILDTLGRAWITDFGLATDGTGALTETGDIVGTIRYMSPERFTGSADERSDIYSIGLTVYEFLTLRPAFEESSKARLIDCIQNSSVAPPSKLEPHVPHDLETIVLKATDKIPERRYQTAEAFAEDLRHFLAGRPIVARRTTWTEQAWLWCRRNPVVASLTAAIATLLVAITLVATVAAFAAREYANDLAAEKSRVEAAELESRRRLFDAYLNEARAVHWSGRPGRRFDSLAAIGKAAELLPMLELPPATTQDKRLLLRNQAIAGMCLSDLQLREAWPSKNRMTSYAFDPDVARYARGDMHGNISIRGISADEPLLSLPGFGLPVWGITFSRDGRYLAARYENYSPAKLRVWDLATQRVLFEVDPVVNEAGVDFSPDGRQVAVARRDGTIEVYDTASRQVLSSIPVGPTANHIRFSPDGSRLAVSSFARDDDCYHVAIWDAKAMTCDKLPHPEGTYRVAWSRNGKRLAVAGADNLACVWDVETKQQRFSVGPYDQPVVRVCFNRTDQLLAVCTWRKTYLCDASSGEQHLVADGQCEHFSANDEWLAYRHGPRLGRWKVGAGFERISVSVAEPLRALDSAKQGFGLVAAAGVGGIEIYDVKRGQKLAHLPGQSLAALFHPNGKELITSGDLGVFRWPLSYAGADNARNMRLGPPHKLLAATGERGRADLDQGNQIAVELKDRACVINLETGTEVSATGHHQDLHYVALSPNGQWVASGTWSGHGVRVWEADSGKLVADLLTDGSHARVFFSPDGKWLVAGIGSRLCFFEVSTWRLVQEVPREGTGAFPGTVAFTRDGKLAVAAVSQRRLELIDMQAWQVLAELEIPDGSFESLCFADGDRRLAAATGDGVVIWDLQSIREELRGFALDWRAEHNPAEQAREPSADHVTLTVDLGSYGVECESVVATKRAAEQAQAGHWESAIVLLENAIELDPRNASAQNLFAWLLSTCPEEAFRNPSRAVEHARESVELNPDASEHWNTLGVAMYRCSQWDAAIEALKHSDSLDPATFRGHNGFFLAMAYWQLDKREEAGMWFERANAFAVLDDGGAEELRRFREEASKFIHTEAEP